MAVADLANEHSRQPGASRQQPHRHVWLRPMQQKLLELLRQGLPRFAARGINKPGQQRRRPWCGALSCGGAGSWPWVLNLPARTAEDIERVLPRMASRGAGAVIVLIDGYFFAQRRGIARLALCINTCPPISSLRLRGCWRADELSAPTSVDSFRPSKRLQILAHPADPAVNMLKAARAPGAGDQPAHRCRAGPQAAGTILLRADKVLGRSATARLANTSAL